MALLTTDSVRNLHVPRFCTLTDHYALEGGQSKLCLHLLGHGGGVGVDVTPLGGTARGIYVHSGLLNFL